MLLHQIKLCTLKGFAPSFLKKNTADIVTTENPKSYLDIWHYGLHFLSKTQDTRKLFLYCFFEFKGLYLQTDSDECMKASSLLSGQVHTSANCHDSTSPCSVAHRASSEISNCSPCMCLSTSSSFFRDAGSLSSVRPVSVYEAQVRLICSRINLW
jgi:hypothetical protein